MGATAWIKTPRRTRAGAAWPIASLAAAVVLIPAIASWPGAFGAPLVFAQSASATPNASADSVRDTARDLQQLGSWLNDRNPLAVRRDDAARRLVARRSPEATRILTDAFATPGNQLAQIAIARALAQSTAPDPVFVPLLVNTLGGNARLTDAAASALVNYRDNAAIFQLLQRKADDQSLPDPSRVAIVRAMGGIIQRPVANYLVRTMFNSNESAEVQNAAADALGTMTGLSEENARDRQRWQGWWQQNGGKNDDQFRSDVLGSQLRQFAQTKLHYTQLVNSLQTIVGQDYAQLQTPGDRVAALKRYLSPDGPTPELRVAGANLVSGDFESGRPVPDEVRQALRVLIGDADPGVRGAAIGTLGIINDRLAAPALITQLVQETDPRIKKLIARALGNINDLSAVAALLSVLNDPLFDVDAAAATALGSLGPALRQDNPALAHDVADRLRRELDSPRAHDPNAVDLRVACTAALATLNDPRLGEVFRSLAAPSEDDRVRVAALQGLGILENPNDMAVITANLNDPDAAVRLAAAKAMENVAGFGQAQQLFDLLDPMKETDPHVRDQCWVDLRNVLAKGTKEELIGWPDQFKDNPDHRLVAQQDLANALDQEIKQLSSQQPPPAPGMLDNDQQTLAEQRQNIGETLMELHRPADAAEMYREAMEYWTGQGRNQPASGNSLVGLVGDMQDALLSTGNYDQATAFAARQLEADREYQRIVGPKIKNEASRLKDAGDNAAALRLIGAALKMNPALDARYQEDLQETANQAQAGGTGTGG